MIGFRKSHAVVIGIDGYGHGIPSLRTAVNDASKIARVLETGYGYTVRLLTEDVSLVDLRAVFDESLPREIEADDRLLVYFAGHGIALDGDDGPAGYLVPQDARRQDKGSFLPMTDLNRWLDRLPCRHLLLVLDCCFAGAYRWSSTRDLGALPEVIHRERFDRYIKDPAWQVITSAAYDQKALDVLAGEILGSRGADHGTDGHSPFAMAFLRALEKGEADLIPRGGPGRQGGDGVITATELYLYLRECVEVGAETDGHLQTPGIWPLKKHDKGEYTHLVPGHVLNLPPAPALDEANNPWLGLQSYDEEHAYVFFGRSRFVSTLADRVRAQPLTVVLGASGTGKSSAVKAGLVSRLRQTDLDAWRILPPIRPGKSPLASLAGLLLPGENSDDLAMHLAEFRIDPEALAKRVGAWIEREPDGDLLLLVIDQFEELITLCWDSGERDHLMQLLQQALIAHPTRLRVVLTLRSDFEPQFARSPLEADWVASRVVVPTMTLDEYRETIEGPASVKVLYFKGKSTSREFINRLIGDVANTPGALPLLSFTLSELYRRYLQRGGDDRALCEEDYEALGGVGGSLRNRAEEVYTGLPDDAAREMMRRVMLRMISIEAGEVARRHVPDTELVYGGSAENERVADVLRRLTEARLVVEGKETDDEPYVEPAHDELIRGWDRLLLWIRDDAESFQLRRRLTPAADAWNKKPTPGALWITEPRLGMLRKILDSPGNWLNAVETRFVRRSWFWRRVGQVVIALAFLVISGLGLVARDQRNQAVASLAETQKTLGNADLAAGISVRDTDNDPIQAAHYFLRARSSFAKSKDLARFRNATAAALSLDPLVEHSIPHGSPLRGATFSRDGTRVMTWSRERDDNSGTVVIWNWHTGHVFLHRLYSDPIETAWLSDDGEKYAMLTRKGIFTVWSLASNDPVHKPLEWGPGVGRNLWFIDNMTRFVTFDPDQGVSRVWDGDGVTRIPLDTKDCQIQLDPHSPFLIVTPKDQAKPSRLWDLATGRPTQVFSRVTGAAFDPNSGRFVTWNASGVATVREIGKPESNDVLPAETMPISGATFAADGSKLFIWASSKTSSVGTLWSIRANRMSMPLRTYSMDGSIGDVALNREGTRILTRGDGGGILVWDQSSRDIKARIDILKSPDRPFAGISTVCFCSDGERIAMSFLHDTQIQVWDIPVAFGMTLAPSLFLKHQPVPRMYSDDYTASMCPDGGSRLLSLNSDGVARVWNLSPKEREGTAFGGEGEIISSCISPTGRFFAGLQEGHLRLWRMEDRQSIPVPIGDTPSVERVVFSDDDSTMVAWRGDGSAVHWKIGRNENPEILAKSSTGTTLIHSTERYVVTADKGGKVSVLDAKSGALVGTVVPRGTDGSPSVVVSAAISRNAKTLLTFGKDGVARLWSLPDGAWLQTLSHSKGNVRGIPIGAVSDDGTQAVTHEKNVFCWNVKRPEPVAELLHHLGMGPGGDTGSTVLGAVFTGGSGRVMTWAADGFVRFWDPKTGDLIKSFQQDSILFDGQDIVAALNPDESMLFTATIIPGNAPAKLWDVESGRVLRDLHAHGGYFSADGRYLITLGDNGTRVLDLLPGRESHSDAEIVRFQVRSASELTDAGQFRILDWREWQKRKESLTALEAGSK